MLRMILILLVGLLTSPNNSFAEMQERLVGRPISKASCDVGGCTHQVLSEVEKASAEMVITKGKNTYNWTSREGKVLVMSRSGGITDYVSSGGYVRVTESDGKCLYMENLTLALKTVIYWGACEEK